MPYEFTEKDILGLEADAVVIPHLLHDDVIPKISRRIMDAACETAFTMMSDYKWERGNGYEVGVDFVDDSDFCDGCFMPFRDEYPLVTVMPGYKLKTPHTLHVCVPGYEPFYNEAEEIYGLCRCYEMVLNVAKRDGITRLAFPLLGTDVFGYPYDYAYSAAAYSVGRWLEKNTSGEMRVYIVLPGEKPRENARLPLPDFGAGSVFIEYAERMAREIAHSQTDRLAFFRSRVEYYLTNCRYSDSELEDMIDCDHTLISRLRSGRISATNKRRAVALAVCMGLRGYEFYEFVVSAAIKHRYPSDDFDLAVEAALASGASDFRVINAALCAVDPSYALDAPVGKNKERSL